MIIIDYFIQFNTSFYKDGILVRNRIEIIKRYIAEEFLMDLLPTISMIL